MADEQRRGRVSQEILRYVNQALAKEVNDPRVQGVTITDVELTGDLQEATVYYSTLSSDQEDKESVQKGLDKATGLIQSAVGQNLTTYHTPILTFKRDESIEKGSRIDELLNQLKNEEN